MAVGDGGRFFVVAFDNAVLALAMASAGVDPAVASWLDANVTAPLAASVADAAGSSLPSVVRHVGLFGWARWAAFAIPPCDVGRAVAWAVARGGGVACVRRAETKGRWRPRAPASPRSRLVLLVLLPPAVALADAACRRWARRCHYALARRYVVRQHMAMASTLGGGWASVRRPVEALRAAVTLFKLAHADGDEACKRKCRVFVGYAHMWVGNDAAAAAIFARELARAVGLDDVEQGRRCVAALRQRPLFRGQMGGVTADAGDASVDPSTALDVGAVWTSVFSPEARGYAVVPATAAPSGTPFDEEMGALEQDAVMAGLRDDMWARREVLAMPVKELP